MADITENLTAQMQETLEKGISLAIFSKNPQVVPLHIFWLNFINIWLKKA